VGARAHDQLGNDTGSAYVFVRDQGGVNAWGQVRELLPPSVLNNDQFGYSVSISRDKLALGVPFSGFDNQSKYGSAYAYARHQADTNNWGVIQKLDRSDPENNDQFGLSVNIGQDTVIIGVNGDDDRGNESGSAYIYRLKYNNAPRLTRPIADTFATNGQPFLLVLPSDTFADPDVGDTLRISASLQDGSPLPPWLSFNPATLAFSGVPNLSGIYFIRVTATDEDGSTGSALFHITVPGSSTILGFAGPVNLTIGRDPQTGALLLTYDRAIGSDGFEPPLEVSHDLQSWQSASSRLTIAKVVPVDSMTERVTYQVTLNSQAAGEFFRLRN
jgi:hypothetical protein